MVQALRDAKRKLAERKAEVGEEQAIEELEASLGLNRPRRNAGNDTGGSDESDSDN